jgi:hypothetical protein
MNASPSQILVHCPLCQGKYEENDIQKLFSRGAAQLLHCACSACGRAMLALLLESSGWVSSVGMVTDLQAHEATEALHRAPLSLEECVSIHQALSETSQVLCQKWLKTK